VLTLTKNGSYRRHVAFGRGPAGRQRQGDQDARMALTRDAIADSAPDLRIVVVAGQGSNRRSRQGDQGKSGRHEEGQKVEASIHQILLRARWSDIGPCGHRRESSKTYARRLGPVDASNFTKTQAIDGLGKCRDHVRLTIRVSGLRFLTMLPP